MTIRQDMTIANFQRFYQMNNLTYEQAEDVLRYLEKEGITERQDAYFNEEDNTPEGKLKEAFYAGWEACEDDWRSHSTDPSDWEFKRWMKRNT